MDAHANFAYSTVATAPSPAASGTSLIAGSGEGVRFPATPFNATIGPVGVPLTPANAEIVRVTGIVADTLTIMRAQEGTSARSVVVGDAILVPVTAKTLTDIEAALITKVFDSTLGSDNASIDTGANAIPGTGSNLRIICSVRSAKVATFDAIHFQLNGDTGNNYYSQLMSASNVTFSGGQEISSVNNGLYAECSAASAPANYFGSVIIDISGYQLTDRKKAAVIACSYVKALSSGNIIVQRVSSFWDNTAAINQVRMFMRDGANLLTGTYMKIYVY